MRWTLGARSRQGKRRALAEKERAVRLPGRGGSGRRGGERTGGAGDAGEGEEGQDDAAEDKMPA